MSIIIKCPTTESNELELARDAYQLGYKAGTKEQSERITELEAEVERLNGALSEISTLPNQFKDDASEMASEALKGADNGY